MSPKTIERKQAIQLRKEGLSYREILEKIPVAKSTLSLWLRSVRLAKEQKQQLTAKRLAAVYRGGEAKRRARIELTQRIKIAAINEIKKISKRELWLMGIMLYWGEGSKEKSYGTPNARVIFSNSDPKMIKLFLKWLVEILKIPAENLKFDIYIHENCKSRVPEVKKFWAQTTGLRLKNFENVYFKKNKVSTVRKNTGDTYHGLLRVSVRRSSMLLRKISGWIEGVHEYYYCRVV